MNYRILIIILLFIYSCETNIVNNKKVTLEFDEIFIALGRKANIKGFGLDKLNIKIRGNGTIEANQFLQTNYSNIYVCGDVTGPYQFTHSAAHQAWYASVNALFSPIKKFKVDSFNKVNLISQDIVSNLIKDIFGEDLNKSSVEASVLQTIKEYEKGKYK